MCLNKILETIPQDDTVVVGYKLVKSKNWEDKTTVVSIYFAEGIDVLPTSWVEAEYRNRPILPDDELKTEHNGFPHSNGDRYRPGFHVLLSQEDCVEFGRWMGWFIDNKRYKIIKVEVRKIHTIGLQEVGSDSENYCSVGAIVAHEMRIIEVLDLPKELL